MDQRIERVFVAFAVLLSLLTLYFLYRSGGCGKCLYREYSELFSLICRI